MPASHSNNRSKNIATGFDELRARLIDNSRALLIVAVSVIAGMIIGYFIGNSSNEASSSNEPKTTNSGGNNSLSVTNTPLQKQETYQDKLDAFKADKGYGNARSDLTYAELFRNSDKYIGTYVHYTGKVIQVLGDLGDWNLRVNITRDQYGYYDDTVYIFSYSPDRVIEDDIIEFTARVNGTMTYKSALGADITLPSLTIYEQTVVGRDD